MAAERRIKLAQKHLALSMSQQNRILIGTIVYYFWMLMVHFFFVVEVLSMLIDIHKRKGFIDSLIGNLIFLITFLQDLDFEAKTSYTLRIEAANKDADPRFLSLGPFSDTTTVKIIVEDVDEPPVFSSPLYPMEVSEATQVGNIIGTVAAHDPDSSNSPVR